MNDPVVLLLFLATWGGIVLVFRRLTDDLRKAAVRESHQPAQVDEELLRLTTEVQETVEGLGEALTRRAEQLKTLIAEADTRIAALAEAPRATLRPAPPEPAAPALPAVEPEPLSWAAEPDPEPEAEHAPQPSAAPTNGRGSAREVYRLAAEGHDADTIARLTNRGREEVRLLLRRTN
ncbi:MAG TPA: hypothetical protein VFX49_13205 [Chloroflexota bacterium]|nr:hypothetical protein [Chloroflexota bacterium]